jgi:hypothetical protein
MACDVGRSPATNLLLAVFLLAQLHTSGASATEVCHFTGTTDHGGHVAATTTVTTMDGVTRVDVLGSFESTAILLLHVHYLIEEVSTWRAGTLESVAVNNRYLVENRIVRQQWDTFQRVADGLEAHRVQGKTFGDFCQKYPGFAQHWDPATFGQPWLRDYPLASPERRADLDLKGSPLPSGLRSPLAMAFYWVRWLPRGGEDVPVFLPGFKADRLVDLSIAAVPSSEGTLWQAPLRYAALSRNRTSMVTAQTSPDGHLLQLAFEGEGRGLITQRGCEGTVVAPAGAR